MSRKELRSQSAESERNSADVVPIAPVDQVAEPGGVRRRVTLANAGLVLAALALPVIGIWVLTNPAIFSEAAHTGEATVQPQTLELTVLGRGSVEPARVVPIRSPIESNRARIVWLAPEGERVAAQELIARFDKHPFVEALELAEQRAREAAAKVVRAEKALALTGEDNAGKREAAQRLVEVAEIEFEDAQKGSGPIELRRLRAAVDKAARGLHIAEVEQQDYASLFEEGHISRKELEVSVDGLRNAADTLALARDEYAGYERFELPRRVREVALKLDGARAELARVDRTALLDQQRLEADRAQASQEAAVAGQMVQKGNLELSSIEVRAPIAGTLLYAEVPGDGERRKVQVGDAVWLGQTFLQIPDTSDLDVHLLVREIDVAKLAPGLGAEIELDAFFGQQLGGVLTRVASIGKSAEQGPRQFLAEVRFNQPPAGVQVGMSANVAIVHRRVDADMAVPVQALRFADGHPLVAVLDDSGVLAERIIELGESDGKWVGVLKGLEPGERIALR